MFDIFCRLGSGCLSLFAPSFQKVQPKCSLNSAVVSPKEAHGIVHANSTVAMLFATTTALVHSLHEEESGDERNCHLSWLGTWACEPIPLALITVNNFCNFNLHLSSPVAIKGVHKCLCLGSRDTKPVCTRSVQKVQPKCTLNSASTLPFSSFAINFQGFKQVHGIVCTS